MNDIPIDQLPPNALHLQRSKFGNRVPKDQTELASSDFDFTLSPFNDILQKDIVISCDSPTFGFKLKTDEINNCTFIQDIAGKSSANKSFDFA